MRGIASAAFPMCGAVIVTLCALVPSGPYFAGSPGAELPHSSSVSLLVHRGEAGATVTPASALLNPYASGMAASLVVGQPNFSSRNIGSGPANLSYSPYGGTFDAKGDLWVADNVNDRVLEYRPPLHDGMNASLVIGQTSLYGFESNATQSGLMGPEAVAFDATGDLWVSDSGNNRVLEFVPPFTSGMNATLVLGQSGFLGSDSGFAATNLSGPTGLGFNASGELFVADSGNNRVVGYTPPFVTGMSATLVLGQPTFTTTAPSTTQSGLYGPTDVAVGPNGALWVADFDNNRVVEFFPPFSDGMVESGLLGPSSFLLTNGTAPYELSYPWGVAFDAGGDLWVSDSGDARVLEYPASVGSHERPSVVIGEPNLNVTRAGPVSSTNLTTPAQTFFDPSGNLWVVDSQALRVLEFAPTAYVVSVNETGLANGTAWSATFDGQVGSGVAPAGIVFSVWNGTHPFSVGAIPGYTSSPTSGSVTVTGHSRSFFIVFSAATTSSSGPTTGQLELAVYVLVAVVVVLALLLVWQGRRQRAGRAPPASSWEPPAPSTPPPPPA